jgi:hypothetical protein
MESKFLKLMTASLLSFALFLPSSIPSGAVLPVITPISLKEKAGTMAEPVVRRRVVSHGHGHRAHGPPTRTVHKSHSYKATTVSRGHASRSYKDTTVARGNARYSDWVRGKSWTWHGWSRPGRYHWPPGAAIAAGVAIGWVTAATAVAWAGPPPVGGLCWYYTNADRTEGFWDVCQ